MTVGDRKVFGSGTRLIVTDQKVQAPKVYGYLPSKKNTDKQTMLCHASGMFPDYVTFKWQKNTGPEKWEEVSEEKVVEQKKKDSPDVTSMMILDKNEAINNDYRCTVTHEGNTVDKEKTQTVLMKKETSTPEKKSKPDGPKPTCPVGIVGPIETQLSGDSEKIPSMFLYVYAYSVLLMKNGLFFCVVSIFLLKRKAGKKDESS